MHTYTLRTILIEADSGRGIPDDPIPIYEGRLRIRPIVPPQDETLRGYLTEALGAWTGGHIAESLGKIVDAAKEKIGAWVDQSGSAVAAARAQDGSDESLVVVISDTECRNTARLRFDLSERTPVVRPTVRDYYLAAVKLRRRPRPEAATPLDQGWSNVTLYQVPTGIVFPVHPRIPEWDWTLNDYLSEVGFPGNVCEAILAKAGEQLGAWVNAICSGVSVSAYSEGYGSLSLLITSFEDQKIAEVALEFGPRKAASGEDPGEAPQS